MSSQLLNKNAIRILVVDDEESLCEILQFNLEVEGYKVDVAYSAEQAMTMNLENYSLIMLDVMMGPMSGFKMAQLLKKNKRTASIPIIFCTAKDQEDDTVAGLNLGADDYISKPFSIREVLARVQSVLRRTEHNTDQEKNGFIYFKGLTLNLLNKTCTVDNIPVNLTKKELEILALLLDHKNKILSREEILHKVWSDDVIVLDRTIDVNITRLRKKIEPYGKYIVTRLGFGYGFQE
ncbi:MAG: Phosphate regulon transcriptional regulatory protein PhoB [Bacteroidetes bacterium ADurb.Bin037]|nr:MAG: Phosphate regulon transcriptional regulatory protein PhoB [Bacteroidetes bacterium ADurb.Bin037]HPW77726.1 response regulator transcription factor [Bacteroidales bacterium]HQB55467.1 response regulator transcription factor [Bacteroidales bacterium]